MRIISSINNEKIKHLKKLLNSSKYRKSYNELVLEGIHLLKSVIKANIIKEVYIENSYLQNEELNYLISFIDNNKISIISSKIARELSFLESSISVFILVKYRENHSLDLINNDDCVLLDRIQDPGNLGTIIRSCASFDIKHLLLSNGCVDPYSPKVIRAAMGTHFNINIYININLEKFLNNYKGNIFFTILDKDKSNSLVKTNLTNKNAWVFGNEGSGIDKKLLQDIANINKVFIPMNDDIDSLNVSMAASICLYEQFRQRINLGF